MFRILQMVDREMSFYTTGVRIFLDYDLRPKTGGSGGGVDKGKYRLRRRE